MSYSITTYKAEVELSNRQYLSHMNLGNDLFISFFGSTKEEAEAKARSWYEAEARRWGKIETPSARVVAPTSEKPLANDGWGSAFKPDARGTHFAGKIWMLNSQNHKVRVDASEQAKYEAEGYVKGGPRSTWKD